MLFCINKQFKFKHFNLIMKHHSLSIKASLLESITKDASSLSKELSTQPLKGFLKKDIDSIYSFADKDLAIKIVFNQNVLNEVLSSLSYSVAYEHLNGILFI